MSWGALRNIQANPKYFLNSFENSFESFIAIQSNNYFSDIVAVLYDTFTLYTK